MEDYDRINRELELFDAELATKPQIVVANKIDLDAARENVARVRAAFATRGIELRAISTVTREGVAELMQEIAMRLQEMARAAAPAATSAAVARASEA